MFTPLIFTSNDQATKRSLRPNERLVRLTAYLASLFNAVISDLKSLNCSFVFLVSAINSLNLSFVPKIANGSKNHKIARTNKKRTTTTTTPSDISPITLFFLELKFN
ncbi:hypothetical protein BSPLISOX_2816 [uncultured Gammaproteobacteria bacterium]|nr:hypothetical protein BSPLISOX_2816 [uncultured Gammaproteobacteria bacterium]